MHYALKKHLFHSDKNNQYLSMLNVRLFWLLRECQATLTRNQDTHLICASARGFL